MKRNIAKFIPYYPTKRPYPFDIERKQKIERQMFAARIYTIEDLAQAINLPRQQVSAVINGTRLSRKTEERIAAFFGMRREELFLQRTLGELAEMNRAQLEAKQRREG